MNKGKTILFCVIGLLVFMTIGIFIYIFSLDNGDKKANHTDPLLNSKDSLTYKDMMNITNEYSNTQSTETTKDSLQIRNQIASLYGMNNNQSSEISKPVNEYVEPKNKNYNNSQYDYLYENKGSNISYSPTPVNTNASNKETENKRSWINPNYKINTENQATSKKSSKMERIYEAMITGARNTIITQENNRVSIRVTEPFIINGVEIPKNTLLVAYANFGSKLTLKINSIRYNNSVIPVNIRVLDNQGQDALEIIGGTGSDIGNEASQTAQGELKTGEGLVDKGIDILTKKRAKMKARISSDVVLLKIEN